jgi:hypothetical protein
MCHAPVTHGRQTLQKDQFLIETVMQRERDGLFSPHHPTQLAISKAHREQRKQFAQGLALLIQQQQQGFNRLLLVMSQGHTGNQAPVLSW